MTVDEVVRGRHVLAPSRVARIRTRNETPFAGPGRAAVHWTVRRNVKTCFFPKRAVESVNMATVIEVRGGKVVRLMPYGTGETLDSVLMR